MWAAIKLFVAVYINNLLIHCDRGINSLILMGSPDETISQRLGRAKRESKIVPCFLCRQLNWMTTHHCDWSIQPGDSTSQEIWHWSDPTDVTRTRRP